MTGRVDKEGSLSIVVLGASGDLALRKIFPALFSLYCQGFLPADFNVFGFARSSFDAETFRAHIATHLTCRYTPEHSCADLVRGFLARCHYVPGSYTSRDSFLDLYSAMKGVEGRRKVDRLFYMAVPSAVFVETARAIGGAGMSGCDDQSGWTRVVMEKPFGSDRETSDVMVRELAKVFPEKQTFRIDHYLGKEVVQNLMVLRFANTVFEPIWSGKFIERVDVNWKENIGVGSRGGYFDSYGIIRDVVQNHLLQILSLVAMERPRDIQPCNVRDAKVGVLRSIAPVALRDMVLGQYSAGRGGGTSFPAYRAEPGVGRESITPTFASCVLRIDNDRWRGVPFVVTAGKGTSEALSEVRIKFREVGANIFCRNGQCPAANEFVIRIQPDEALILRITNKEPGLDVNLVETDLNLKYRSTFARKIPDAYECLLLDVISGDRSLFISQEELAASWDIFTPVLHEIDSGAIAPRFYDFGSAGPAPALA
ncbi:MAG: glucose-6-phosphate dehydrogenase [bacterium]